LTKDALVDENAGVHPWSLENGNGSTMLLFNQSNRPQDFHVQLTADGVVWSKVLNLPSLATEEVNITDIVNKHVPDDNGQKLPPLANAGIGFWYVSGTGLGKGRMLISNSANGMARSFSCGNYATVGGAKWGGSISKILNKATTDIGSVVSEIVLVTGGQGCVGTFQSWQNSSSYTYAYSSSNHSVATVALDANQLDADVTGAAGGTTIIAGTVTDGFNHCGAGASTSILNQVPTSLSIVAGTDSTSSESGCTTSGGLAGCGVGRTFKYQVNDQSGGAIKINALAYGDVICTSTPNNLLLAGYVTTCGGTTGSCSGTPGPCGGLATDANGQFTESIGLCAPACKGASMAGRWWQPRG
jgi:hypothetical protein